MKSKWSLLILNGRLTFLGIVGLVVTGFLMGKKKGLRFL